MRAPAYTPEMLGADSARKWTAGKPAYMHPNRDEVIAFFARKNNAVSISSRGKL
jgi:hypothetical protein